MGMHIVIIGNPIDGFSIIGPFSTFDEAVEWASTDLASNEPWWAMKLESPSDWEDEQS